MCTDVRTPCVLLLCRLARADCVLIAFLWGFVQYEAKGRISAEAALRHPYFKSLGERVHLLPDSKCTGSLLPGGCGAKSFRAARGWWSAAGSLQTPLVFACSEVLLQQSGVGAWWLRGQEAVWVGARRGGVREKSSDEVQCCTRALPSLLAPGLQTTDPSLSAASA